MHRQKYNIYFRKCIALVVISIYGSFFCWSCNNTGRSGSNMGLIQDEGTDSVVEGVLDTLLVSTRESKEDKLSAEELAKYPKPPFIIIDKGDFTLKLYDEEGKVEKTYPVGVAVNYGKKTRKGDQKTPEGVFEISMIQPSSGWSHNFGDGKGVIKGCYGPWFLRLKTPVSPHIGIHGTHDPASIGTRCTEGCIRMLNEDVAELKEKVKRGMKVIILPGPEDEKVNNGIR